jgi:hypothetical protein
MLKGLVCVAERMEVDSDRRDCESGVDEPAKHTLEAGQAEQLVLLEVEAKVLAGHMEQDEAAQNNEPNKKQSNKQMKKKE